MSSEIDEVKAELAALKKVLSDELGISVNPRQDAIDQITELGYKAEHVELACDLAAKTGANTLSSILTTAKSILNGFDVQPPKNIIDVVVEKTINTTIQAAKKAVPVIRKTVNRLRKVPKTSGRNMNRKAQIGMARKHLESHGIPSDTVDVAGLTDSSLSFGENWDNIRKVVGISSHEHRRTEMERFNDQAQAEGVAA